MSEKPILFSSPMVLALLAGRKHQTRRVAKLTANGLAKLAGNHAAYLRDGIGLTWIPFGGAKEQPMPPAKILEMSPYGSRLWVKEGLIRHNNCIVYAANYPDKCDPVPSPADPERTATWSWKNKTLPGMFMPRWASRITLLVKTVRCERLQEITEADAAKEGVTCDPYKSGYEPGTTQRPRQAFQLLWDKLNGKKHPWDSNPWVWVIEFERSKP